MTLVERLDRLLAAPDEAPYAPRAGSEAEAAWIVRFGVAFALVAAAVQTVAHLANWFALDRRFAELNADDDRGVFAWASSATTAVAAFCALALAFAARRHARRLVGLAGILLFFSLDDVVRIHERAATNLREEVLGLPSGFGRLIWPVLFFPLLAASFALLWQVAARSRGPAGRALKGALLLLVAAVVLEALSTVVDRTSGSESALYGIEVAIEEAAELAGWIVIAFALAATAFAVLVGRAPAREVA